MWKIGDIYFDIGEIDSLDLLGQEVEVVLGLGVNEVETYFTYC
jgi:hypothetical protein